MTAKAYINTFGDEDGDCRPFVALGSTLIEAIPGRSKKNFAHD